MGEFFMNYGPALFWVAVATVAVIVESQTCELISIWFVPGAIIAMVLSFFGVEFWIQTVVFVAFSAVTLTLVHTALKKYLPKRKETKTNVDALIGVKGIVEEDVDNIRETGSVKVRGLVWTARSTDDAIVIQKGSVVTVQEIVGVKMICQIDSAKETP